MQFGGITEHKAYVIGAGTAGLIAAHRLAQNGIDTTVFDQKHVLGYPVRASGILSITGLADLGIDYSRCMTNTLYGARIHAGRSVMRIVSQDPVAHVLDRKKLNDVCHDIAVSSGAEVNTKKKITGADLDSLSKRGVVIGADGAVSTVAKHFGLGNINRMVLTYKAEFNVSSSDSRIVDLFFDKNRYPGLFAWLCPNSRDMLEIGVGVDSRLGNAKKAFDAFVSSDDVKDVIGDAKPVTEGASVIPMSMRRRMVDESRRVMLVGDAAGQVKPTTGGGIIFGGKAAIIAADTLKGYYEGSAKLSDYEAEFRKRHEMDLRIHAMLNSIYCSSSPESLGRVINVLNTFGFQRFLGMYGDMDRPSLIIKRFFLRSLA